MAENTYFCTMKNLILTVFCLGMSATAFAQFNTIAGSTSFSKGKLVKQIVSNDSSDNDKQNNSTPPVTLVTDDVRNSVSIIGETVDMDVDSVKMELIKQYLSVAYPLSHIEVTSPYGMRRHPVMRKRMMHEGIDLRAKYEEVYSVMDGDVVAVSSDRRSGRYVTVRYPGAYTCSYCHLSRTLVRIGDHVSAGEVIAVSGNTGMSTGAHLHFGVRGALGERIDPTVLLEYIRSTRESAVKKLQQLNTLAQASAG